MREVDRRLSWDGCANVRDLGGLSLGNGSTTKWRAVVRSDNPAYLSTSGWQSLYDYGVRTVIGLRTIGAADDEPSDLQIPRGIRFVRLTIEDVTDREFFDRRVANGLWGTPLYFVDALQRWPDMAANVLAEVAGAPPGGVVISCGRGCDRTGFIAMLLLHLVGVTTDEIADDYAMSVEQLAERDPDYPSALASALEKHHATVRSAIGEALTVPVTPLLERGGLRQLDVERIRTRLT